MKPATHATEDVLYIQALEKEIDRLRALIISIRRQLEGE